MLRCTDGVWHLVSCVANLLQFRRYHVHSTTNVVRLFENVVPDSTPRHSATVGYNPQAQKSGSIASIAVAFNRSDDNQAQAKATHGIRPDMNADLVGAHHLNV